MATITLSAIINEEDLDRLAASGNYAEVIKGQVDPISKEEFVENLWKGLMRAHVNNYENSQDLRIVPVVIE